MENIFLPKNLIDIIKLGNFGLFIGAGLSIASGYPSWQELLKELIDKIKQETQTDHEILEELDKLSEDPSKYLLVAETIKEIFPDDIYKYIKNRFDNNKAPLPIHEKLLDLNSKFIITTNYDTLIENAYVKKYERMPNVYTYKDAASINFNLYEDIHFILKSHGDSSRAPNEIILTEKDYRRLIYNERGYQSVLQTIFSTFNILFFGVSLNDPEVNLLLAYIHHIFHGGTPDHFAFISKEKITKTEKERWRKDFKIHIIDYDQNNNHQELELIVDKLLEYKKSLS